MRLMLKWAGGKRQLLPYLRAFYPSHFERYVEPFFGSGAVFFDLHAAGRLRDREAILIDSNADLIGCYEQVRDRPEEVLRELEALARAFGDGGRTHYYEVRDRQFNPERDRLRQGDGQIQYTPALAAMFIYLNRTGFNGLFRLNARGGFNVPAGRYVRPNICDRERLLRTADALSGAHVQLRRASFESAGAFAERGDFLYVDPPYAPVSETANFTAYTADRFGPADQRQLQSMLVRLARRGCYVLLSNSTASEITAMYEQDREAIAAGLKTVRVPARRAINRDRSGRGPVEEYLITNISGHRLPPRPPW
jgi:DNA adenine methylase